MAQNPMGFIFAGNVKQVQRELASLLMSLTTTTTWAGTGEEKGVQSQPPEAEVPCGTVEQIAVGV